MARFDRVIVCLLIVASSLSSGFAARDGWSLTAPSMQSVSQSERAANSNFYKRLLMPFVDAIPMNLKPTTAHLSAKQNAQAKTWGLTRQEALRYTRLMKGKDRVYYTHSGLTPVQILGINARTNKSRDYYAKLASLQRAERTAKEEAFFSAYGQAYSNLMRKLKLPAVRTFNVKPFSPLNNTRLGLKAGDHVLLFINGSQAVSPMVTQALFAVMQTPHTHLNIYFEGKNDTKSSIEAWANHQSIPKRLVQTGIITLNLQGDRWKSLSGSYALPALFIVRGGKTIALKVRSRDA